MKKLFLIAIMIISTCITAYAIMIWQPSDNIITENSIQQQSGEILSNKSNEGDEEIKFEKNKDEDLYEGVENEDGSYISTLKPEFDNDLDKAVQGNVLKVDEDGREKIIPREEKEKIERIIKKLSAVDLISLKEKFNNENKSEGFRDGFALIKRRVSEKEYEEIRKVLEEYIDFTVLETEI